MQGGQPLALGSPKPGSYPRSALPCWGGVEASSNHSDLQFLLLQHGEYLYQLTGFLLGEDETRQAGARRREGKTPYYVGVARYNVCNVLSRGPEKNERETEPADVIRCEELANLGYVQEFIVLSS